MPSERYVFIVDDDADVRDSLQSLLESHAFRVEGFESAIMFLASDAPGRQGCLIVDVRMPGMDGLQLQEELVGRGSKLSVIVMTGHGDVPLAVRAMKAGAVDFLEKPFEENVLLDSVRRALKQASATDDKAAATKLAQERIANLTERERQVLNLLITGRPNKVIAYELSISPRTVEIHRARVMEKMGVRSLAELVRLTLAAPPGSPS